MTSLTAHRTTLTVVDSSGFGFDARTATSWARRATLDGDQKLADTYSPSQHYTRSVQPVATCRQSPYLHKPAIIVMMPFSLSRNSRVWRLRR